MKKIEAERIRQQVDAIMYGSESVVGEIVKGKRKATKDLIASLAFGKGDFIDVEYKFWKSANKEKIQLIKSVLTSKTSEKDSLKVVSNSEALKEITLRVAKMLSKDETHQKQLIETLKQTL
jgi:hypothetical protein